MIYLDNNATTRVADEVLDAMRPYNTEWYGNPHSAHRLGRAAHRGLEEARAAVAELLHTAPSQIRFTSCGTEGNAIVIRGLQRGQRRRVVASAVEHPSVMKMLERLRAKGEIELVTVAPDSSGRLRPEAFASVIDANTALVCVMLAQNETGVLHPVREIAGIARAAEAKILVDAVQAAAKIDLDVNELDADFVTLSGHKLHAPKGIGALWIREGLSLDPLWLGGGQEFGLRSGTEAVALAAGFGEACRIGRAHLDRAGMVAVLRDLFEKLVADKLPNAVFHGAEVERLPNTSSVSLPGWIGPDLMATLDREFDICVSAGAACHSDQVEPSAVLRAMNVPREVALGTVRISLSHYTTRDEITRAAEALIELGRRVSPASTSAKEEVIA